MSMGFFALYVVVCVGGFALGWFGAQLLQGAL